MLKKTFKKFTSFRVTWIRIIMNWSKFERYSSAERKRQSFTNYFIVHKSFAQLVRDYRNKTAVVSCAEYLSWLGVYVCVSFLALSSNGKKRNPSKLLSNNESCSEIQNTTVMSIRFVVGLIAVHAHHVVFLKFIKKRMQYFSFSLLSRTRLTSRYEI